MAPIDITGQRFFRLVALRRGPKRPNSKLSRWYMQCDCGNVVLLELGTFRGSPDRESRFTQSCGCLRKEDMARGGYGKTHGRTHTTEYRAWSHAKARCIDPNDKKYPLYGGRGIRMCDEWLQSFEAFYAHMGPKPHGLTLDRIDNSRGYEPGNCRWATLSQQNKNRRPFKRGPDKNPHRIGPRASSARRIEFRGRQMTLCEIAAQSGLRSSVVYKRLSLGWPIDALGETPLPKGVRRAPQQ